ncbi:MAG TPA: ABC transporter ATP-binding protein [Tepidisphaeraceae bacterium]|nr:ABC transporter ATP-binding protein [Tepidisphaeraceae bacterium]
MADLSADRLSVSLGDRTILRDVTLAVSPGQLVALLGPNGCGKTTLLRALAGLIPSTGKITLSGKPLPSIDRRTIARRIAYLPQAPAVLEGMRVHELLSLGRLPYRAAFGLDAPDDAFIVQAIATQLELADLLDRRIETLSGGQRQRAFIARCLVQQPAILLLDEPATYLDLRHQIELHRLLARLAREQHLAVLMASHDFNLSATHCDQIVLMHEGTIAAAGKPADVLQPEAIERIYDVKVRRLDDHGTPVILPIE